MSARRQARSRVSGFELEGVEVPAELLDGDHPVWKTRDAYFAWLDQHGITRRSAPVRDRIELEEWVLATTGGAHPANRRSSAAEAWAEKHRVCLDPRCTDYPRADWQKLRAAGLID